MTTFALDVNSSSGDIIAGLNYALANLGNNVGGSGTAANVLVANISTGQVTTTSTNSKGYSSTTLVSYLYRYMDVKYANSATGGSGFTSNCTMAQYYGLRNTSNVTISSNPTDYIWYQVSGGFGTTKSLWYATIGGRQIATFAGTAAPQVNYVSVPDMPLPSSTPIDLDAITAAAGNQVVVTNAYLRANTQPATPTGGFYDFATFTLYAPAGWSANVPPGSDPVYTSQAAFSGQISSNVAPQTTWSYPNILSSNFAGNTGPQGQRGPIPMAYVLTSSDPTSYSDSDYTTAFSASRANVVTPIGVGYTPLTGDTSQFLYANLINPNNSITVVKTFDANTIPQWQTVRGNVISGNLFVTGTITSSALNTNDIYTINTQSTNASIGNVSSAGYWFQANTGDARMAGSVSIGNLLKVGLNAQIGANLTVGTNANIGNNLTVGQDAYIGDDLVIADNLRVGTNANIGNNLTVGANAYIGNNITIANVITLGALNANTVGTTQITQGAITTGKIAANAITGNTIQAGTITGNLIAGGTITGNLIAANTITGNLIQANAITATNIAAGSITSDKLAANLILSGDIVSYNATLGSDTSAGYWMQANTGSARFGGNLSIGNIITASGINANVVTTENLVINSATQTVYNADNTNYPLINFVNGTTNNPNLSGYLWPYFTRGFAIGGGTTITTTTDGSVDGSKIIVNYNAYISSATNPEYNVVELWRSGASNYYRNTFRSVRSFKGKDPLVASAENFIVVGENGSFYEGNIGNITQLVTNTTKNFYDGWIDTIDNKGGSYGYAFGQQSQTAIEQNQLLYFSGNLPAYLATTTNSGSAYPLFDIFGVNQINFTRAPSTYQPTVLVGSAGTIISLTGTQFTYGAGQYSKDTSGTYAELRDIACDTGASNVYVAGNTISYVTVGTGGTILYNSRTYNTTGNVSTTTGWSQASSGTISALNGVASNCTNTSTATAWVAVGDQGTILRSSSISGPWTIPSSIPTLATGTNLQGVDYVNGYWVIVGDHGTILTSTDTFEWTGPIANPADGSDPSIGARDLYGVAGGELTNQWVAAGQEIILTSNTANPTTGGWNSSAYLGGISVASSLTRLQYFGSWANIANVSLPPASQRVSNQQIVSGAYTDIDYVSGETITYYMVLGNMAGNVAVTTNGPNMTITEIKR